MTKNLSRLAQEIIEKNQYMTLGTDGWVSPVAYAFDKNYNFYWVSMPDSRHSQNIAKNPRISVAIFDSHQDVGTGVGLQIEGTATKLSLSDYPEAIKLYFGRNYLFGGKQKLSSVFKKFLTNKIYYLYQFSPVKFWMNDPNSKMDVRVEIQLGAIPK